MKKDIKGKKIIALIAAILILLLIIAIVTLIIRHNKNTDEEIGENTIIIKSTSSNKIEKDKIEAEKITINAIGDQLEVKTTLKNNRKEDIKGYLIEIDLLDKNGDIVSTIVDNSSDVIKKKETKEIVNYVNEVENPNQVVNARIVSIEEGSIGEDLEKTIDEIKQNIDNIESQE